MPTYVPVFQRKIDYDTGEELFDESGAPLMEHVRDIIVPEPPVYEYEPTPEELAQMRSWEDLIAEPIQESPTEPDPTQNP